MDLWEIISSSFVLVLFLGVVYAVLVASRKASATEAKTTKHLAKSGVTYSDGKLTVKTDRPQVTREQQVQRNQAKVAMGKASVANRPDAFYSHAEKASGVESPGRGFQRTKKLD